MCAQTLFSLSCCFFLRLILLATTANAQQATDSPAAGSSVTTLRNYTRQRLGADSRLYNGFEYIRNGTPAKGFPFFDSDSLLTGTLSYDGILYGDIAMQYDLVQDELLIHDYTGTALISLINEKIDHFSIGSHFFRYISREKTTPALPRSGFYEELNTGLHVALLARREKKLDFPSNREDLVSYKQSNFYFLCVDDRYFPVDGKTALLEALKDKKSALKKYIRDNKIRFKKDLEKALVLTTGYYMKIRT